jgi:hypothetical protein
LAHIGDLLAVGRVGRVERRSLAYSTRQGLFIEVPRETVRKGSEEPAV